MSTRTALILFGLTTALLIGCGKTAEKEPTSGIEALTLSELVESLSQETKEVQFCLDEEAGFDSLRQCSTRMQAILDALPGSISSSNLPEDKKQKLTADLDSLKSAYSGLDESVQSNGSQSKTSKANKKLIDEVKRISKKYSIR